MALGMVVYARQSRHHQWELATVLSVGTGKRSKVGLEWRSTSEESYITNSPNLVRRALTLVSVFSNIGMTAHGMCRTGMTTTHMFEVDPLAIQVLTLNSDSTLRGVHCDGQSTTPDIHSANLLTPTVINSLDSHNNPNPNDDH